MSTHTCSPVSRPKRWFVYGCLGVFLLLVGGIFLGCTSTTRVSSANTSIDQRDITQTPSTSVTRKARIILSPVQK